MGRRLYACFTAGIPAVAAHNLGLIGAGLVMVALVVSEFASRRIHTRTCQALCTA